MVGDTMDTDKRGAPELGFRSVLKFTGSTRAGDPPRYPYRPTLLLESVEAVYSQIHPVRGLDVT